MPEEVAAAAAPLLEMRNVEKRFPGVIALDKVNFKVYAGEVVALVGENGAGKSTLMKTLGGVHQLNAGEILINGEQVNINSVADATRFGIGFVHQELNVLDNLDIAGNIYLGREPIRGGWLKLIDRPKMRRDSEIYLKQLGLDLPGETPLARLCIAHRQIVEIAKTLSQNARLIIMDEPTSSLTLTETRRLLETVQQLRANGVSIIYVSHRLNEIEEIADRVTVLRDGRNAGDLQRGEIARDAMVRLMVGRDIKREQRSQTVKANQPYLSIKNLRTRRYPEQSVTFDVARGEILGFAGLVGAGRTEVAEAIFGVDKKLGGTIEIENAPVAIAAPRHAIKAGIYLVPEDRRLQGLIVEDEIRQNATLPSLGSYSNIGLIDRKAEKTAATQMCRIQNVKAASIETIIGTLSGGNQQKVVLAKWLALNPKVMIFDEPTRGIDVGAKAEIYELMRRLASEGVAVMVISSDMEEVLGISDRIAVMREGKLTGVLDSAEFSEEAVMRLAVA